MELQAQEKPTPSKVQNGLLYSCQKPEKMNS